MDILRHVNFYDTNTLTEDIGLSIKIADQGNRAHRIMYGSDVIAMTEGVNTLRALFKQRFRWKYGSLQNIVKYHHLIGKNSKEHTYSLTLYRMPMAVFSEIALLLAPLMWFYVLHITLSDYSLALIMGAYATISCYVFITIWLTEKLTLGERLRLTAYTPIAYFIFYLMDIIQFAAALRCAIRLRRLLGQKDTDSTWVSPIRTGRKVALR